MLFSFAVIRNMPVEIINNTIKTVCTTGSLHVIYLTEVEAA